MADWLEQIVSAVRHFNLFDWFILWCGDLVALWHRKGFAREAFSIVGWVSAFFWLTYWRIRSEILASKLLMSRRRDILCPGALPLSPFCWYSVSSQLFIETNASARVQRWESPAGRYFWSSLGVIIIAAISILLRAVLPDNKEDLLDSAVLMDSVNWVAEWIGANFERVVESEPTEAVKDTIDSSDML
ncbi:MAG: hypothetical protein CM15mP84_09010 [Cellvibrionales bacterium]|nr:MAG: hypothetical protein CM15mP84_09010 [Cellvibrionales bacterium]